MLYSLYVKTHLKTGLKYLGYTKQDPHKYQGSGKRWTNHIKTHGYDVWTNILLRSEEISYIVEMGKYYSEIWDITTSSEWANLKPEEGQGGSIQHTKESIQKIKKARANQITTQETKEKYSDRCKRSRWYTNGVSESFTTEAPEGWVLGRITKRRNGKRNTHPSNFSGTLYYNDGKRNYRVRPEDAKPEWVIGMAPRIKSFSTDPA